jgi:hypothetical protein
MREQASQSNRPGGYPAGGKRVEDEPLYMRLDYIPKSQALMLRYVLHEAAAGYAASNPRVKLYQKVEAEIAKQWPTEALR